MLRNTKLTAVVIRNVVFCLRYLFCLVELPIIINKIECQIFGKYLTHIIYIKYIV